MCPLQITNCFMSKMDALSTNPNVEIPKWRFSQMHSIGNNGINTNFVLYLHYIDELSKCEIKYQWVFNIGISKL